MANTKLIDILYDLVYEKQYKSAYYVEELAIKLYLTDYWYIKIQQEMHQNMLPTVFDAEKAAEIKNMVFRIMGARITFIKNKGDIANEDTNLFFDIIYNKL